MSALSRFVRFWYDFVVGDDWVVAATAVVAIATTAVAVHLGWNAWPILPTAVFLSLAAAARRAVRAGPPRRPSS
jgi:hypothetical protein